MNGAAEALKKSAVARYIQLATLFRRRIATGEWEVGERIPTVGELAKECGVATMTIRQALDMLEADDLIERFRAKGTFVKSRPAHDLWCQVQTDWSGMLIARDNAKIEVLFDHKSVVLPSRIEKTGNPAESYRHLRRRHTRDGEAFLLADVYVSEKLTPRILEEDYATKTALRLVVDIPGVEISGATQILTIDTADMIVAELLNIPVMAPVAHVTRCAVDDSGELVLLAKGVYRGDKVRIDFTLR